MQNKALTLSVLAKANQESTPGRSFFLLMVVLLFAFSLFLGSLFLDALSKGVARVSDRMGADLIVVPAGYKASAESILLKGEPSTFYLPEEAQSWIASMPGIEKQTSQLYIATLNASCCSYPVQIIGIDPESDFLIQPWLETHLQRGLRPGEALVGSHVVGEAGEKLHFFNKELKIVGRLDRTGLGMDATVFVNLETARSLAQASQTLGVQNAAAAKQVSVILLRVKAGLDPQKVAAHISATHGADGLFVMSSRSFVSDLAGKLLVLGRIIGGVLVALWLLCIIILILSFSAMTRERQKELAALRILGARRAQLRGLVLREAFRLSVQGTVVGIVLAGVFSLLFFPVLAERFSIPLPVPDWQTVIVFGAATLVLGLGAGPLASLPAAVRVGKQEAYTSMREAD